MPTRHIRPTTKPLPMTANQIVARPSLPWPFTWLTPVRDRWIYEVKGIIE